MFVSELQAAVLEAGKDLVECLDVADYIDNPEKVKAELETKLREVREGRRSRRAQLLELASELYELGVKLWGAGGWGYEDEDTFIVLAHEEYQETKRHAAELEAAGLKQRRLL